MQNTVGSQVEVPMVLLLSESQVKSLGLDMSKAIEVIERAVKMEAEGRAFVHRRVHLTYPRGFDYDAPSFYKTSGLRTLRILPAIVPEIGAGFRVYTLLRGEPVEAGRDFLMLYDYHEMKLRAIIADFYLHTIRTGAPTGLATKLLARRDCKRAAIFGSGRQAAGQLKAILAARRIESVKIYSPNRSHREEFCKKVSNEVNAEVIPAENPGEAVKDVDVVVTITNSGRPVFDGRLIEEGVHVNVAASHDVDDGLLSRARLLVLSKDQLMHGSPPVEPFTSMLAKGTLKPEEILDLGDVLLDRIQGRTSDYEITVFVSSGSGLWDTAIAKWVYDEAKTRGIGVEMPLCT